ncbi:hypothetical protein B0H67DRAFT_241578 [Lasiosphaeris hirsuta]|uniref:DUF6594 domain-containing protein n=1 Tax=Lasiosphaeris hirsuta TaxID=260670 RepID=A0AA40DWC4_9PEZI|nr:hypothetical protein B0H67DRAFT_241578 [Lasiosphaeris hirsuta]
MEAHANEYAPRPRGYTKLAKFMVDYEHVMLKQYRELAVRDLLYLQAELCDLQYDYAQQAQLDSQDQNEERRRYDVEWWHLQSEASRGGDGRQWQLALQIRKKLREYYAAIKQYQEIAAMRRPSGHQQDMVNAFIHSDSLGGNCQFLGRDLGGERPFPSVFSGRNKQDLIFLGEDTGEDDILSRLLKGPGMRMFHRVWKPLKVCFPTMSSYQSLLDPINDLGKQKAESRGGESTGGEKEASYLRHYSDRKLRFASDVFGSAVSSIIPSLAIIVLFFVEDLLRRLALVCLFSFLFSICMSLATRARRIEVFGATAAFASVQVVFVGTTAAS